MSATDHHTAPGAEEKDATTTSASINGGHPHHRFGDPHPNANSNPHAVMASFGGEFQPGLFKSVADRKIANPAPLGLSAFALTTFVLSCVNLSTRGVTSASIAVPLAFGYGGLVQLCAGMWEMAIGNTFGATALSSYGGFWIAWAFLEAPYFGEDGVGGDYADGSSGSMDSAAGFFLMGWFIFTTILLLCTLRSTVMFFSLFFTLDLAFLFLACAHFANDNGSTDASAGLKKAGGVFGMLAAFLAWYNAFAGIVDSSNSFFLIPVFHFPWSEKGREARAAKAVTSV
ncbi:uncharacterized protein MKZ38_010042 [Zalerion maritima]|uniref:Uncharacterized protein n=1 Tax=Zalerion maritima TaxID=339359 RepID=A0AAD5RFN0_9PEZI|nr:uncharacterized protein MKZ38_010042 [Zalerion maritima]